MEKILKQFADWVTDFRSNPFKLARLKLAAWYSLIMLVIITLFSVSLFAFSTRNIRQYLRQNFRTNRIETELIADRISDEFRNDLIKIDLTILAFAFFGSYFLAGYNLRPIKDAMDKQKRFISDASHEFRTPLTVMKTDLELMLRKKEKLHPATIQTANRLLSEVDNLTCLSGKLLNLAKLDEQSPEFAKTTELKKIDLNKILKKVFSRMKKVAGKKSIHIDLQLPEKSIFINGNGQQLQHVMVNLMDNAIKFTSPSGKITLSLNTQNQQAIVKVSDNGVGIPSDDLPQIFDRFYKSDSSRNTSGTGLGLSIAKSILNDHNAQIEVQSEVNKGTEFTIKFQQLNS